ncbi:alpha/beta hydrolase [Rickettsia endosymbiont of Cardiosporidium cionae]|uniref:alpha/beta hydrolase n=1 Tax=Rickettsia endosymbiont of Cardiosporidium cionae TaxID=2777155 RepID=UPI001894B44E|nr:hydrolase [Rickettsia endosymbiont of Cardiosporidium cionae]KAF8818210.1 hydrolase [Rickettsia endosymbiont of Cardiosporidium cionae]
MNKKSSISSEVSPLSGNEIKKLVVMLHGLGSDGNDMISIVPFFQQDITDALFFAPNGIEAYDAGNFGMQWFSAINKSEHAMQLLLQNNISKIYEIISKKQVELSLTNRETIIIGFSQGSMVGLYLTLTQQMPFLAMISFSGKLITPRTVTNHITPICLIHGSTDKIITPDHTSATSEFLNKYNIYNSKLIIPNLGHSIDFEGINFAIKFLNLIK